MALEMVVAGAGKTFRFADGQTVVIGSGVSSDILVGSPDIEARHVLLAHDGASWRAFDLRSRVGTKLNGRAIVQERMADGDRLVVGAVQFDVRIPRPVGEENGHVEAQREVSARLKVEPAVPVSAPARVGPFLLQELAHRGSSGKFYRAHWEEKPGRDLCVKIFSPQLACDENAMYRFCRGVMTAAQIKHPNIVRLYKGGKAGNKWYLVMEWMTGGSLRDRLRDAPDHCLPAPDVVAMGMGVCRALEMAAQKRVMHRKITPSSILFSANGVPKLGDFMLMREVDAEQSQKLTQAGERLGEMMYMSPEQAIGDDNIDHRSDIYSLAACMFEACTGKPPHSGSNVVELLKDINERPVVRASSINRRVPTKLDSILALALAKDPDIRYQSPSQFLEDLENTGIG